MKIMLSCCLAAGLLSSCASIDKRKHTWSATGFDLNILFFQIPNDSHTLAEELVPMDGKAKIVSVASTPQDWRTVYGFLNRLFGVGVTQISGTNE